MKNKKDFQVILLMAGKSTRLEPLNFMLPKGLLSINSKPAICNEISKYIKLGASSFTIVANSGNIDLLKRFFDKAYSKIDFNFVLQQNATGPLDALKKCYDRIEKPVLLLLGDTMCDLDFNADCSFVGYKKVEDFARWCMVKTDKDCKVISLYDKPDYDVDTDKALVGVYYFTDYALLKDLLVQEYDKVKGEYQISSLLERYIERQNILAVEVKNWFDTGTITSYIDSFKKNINGRSFNALTLDDYGVLTKTSNYDKLKSEIDWYERISETGLKIFIPQYFGAEKGTNSSSYKIAFEDKLPLAEYFCFYPINIANWQIIFDKLLQTANKFWEYDCDYDKKECCRLTKSMLIDKTIDRISQWNRTDLLRKEFLIVNGEKLFNVEYCLEHLKDKIYHIIDTSPDYFRVIHGDMCMSNILFSPSAFVFKFIDPRGNFGKDGIWGDLRYDLAKLRHCYHGLYDYQIAGLFSIEEKRDEILYDYFTDEIADYNIFDNILQNYGYNINDIQIIEGLLFLSMIPLHSDNPDRQLMQFITGLKCLNRCLK